MLFILALIRRFGIAIAAAVFTYYLSLFFFPSTEENGHRIGLTIGAGLLGFFLPRIMSRSSS